MKDLRATYGQYAVVTGASSGIGAEFTRQLSAAGVNVVLVARRQDRLEALAAELTGLHGTANEVVAIDLLAEGAVDELCRRVVDLDVGIVVANAGIWRAGPFVDHSLADELDVLTLDAAVPMQLAHRFGQRFAQRHRGGIVLVSSSVAAVPVPNQANYAAVKAYVLSLGLALHHELKKDGVDVVVVSPGITQTEGVDNGSGLDFDKLGSTRMAPSRVAHAALSSLGRRAHVIPGAVNNAGDLVSRHLLPRRVATRVFGSYIRRGLTDNSRARS